MTRAHTQCSSVLLIGFPPTFFGARRFFLRPGLYDAYTAVVCTRNPALGVPAQKTALLMVALCQAATQMMDPKFQVLTVGRER